MAEAPVAAPPWSLVVVPQAVAMDGGEVILLAIRPSAWFIPLVSWPVLAMAIIVAVVVDVAGDMLQMQAIASKTAATICSLAAMARLLAALVQWLGRTYILTNMRIIEVRGVMHWAVFQCPLNRVTGVHVSAVAAERLLGLGSLSFDMAPGNGGAGMTWLHVAHPAEIREMVNNAIGRLK